MDHDPSPSQDRSVVVEVDNSTNNALEEKQLQFVTVEYSPINSGDSLGMHTATLSEYNQQSEVSDSSSVLEPVEISFDFEVMSIIFKFFSFDNILSLLLLPIAY